MPPRHQHIIDFYLRDDNSRLSTGKSETSSNNIKNGERRQIRYLNFSIDVLYEKYASESESPVSRSLFYSLRPFWVRKADLSHRNSCLCKGCSNFQFLCNAAYFRQMIACRDSYRLVESMVCSTKSKECMMRNCASCKDKTFLDISICQTGSSIGYHKWATDTTDGGFKTTVRKRIECSTGDFVKILETSFWDHAAHLYRIYVQQSSLKLIKGSLHDKEVVLLIDFSENYTLKDGIETQASHFGFHHQVTIHQSVCYSSTDAAMSFATLSADLRKTAAAIQAHLQPVLRFIIEKFGSLQKIIFASDSPSSQYRNRFTLYAIEKLTKSLGIESWCWLYSESGHGKGPSDGIGSSLKRGCDREVATGRKIMSIGDMQTFLENKNSKIVSFEISSQDIEEWNNFLRVSHVPKVSGITNAHFVKNSGNGLIYSDLYCEVCNPVWSACECGSFKEIPLFSFVSDRETSFDSPCITTTDNQEEKVRTSPFEVDQWVIANFNGKWYPGKIIALLTGTANVSCMELVRRMVSNNVTTWKWPDPLDVLDYSYDLLKPINVLSKSSSRTRELIDFSSEHL